MKIAIFMNDLNSGGAEKIMVGYLNYLIENTDDEVTLILARKKGPYSSLIDKRINTVYLNKEKIFFAALPLYKYLKQNKIDAVYATLVKPNLIAIMAGKLAGIKVVIRVANTIKEFKKSKKSSTSSFAEFLSRHLFKYIHKCIAISKIVKADLITYTNCRPEQIEVIYNPIMIIDDKPEATPQAGCFHIALVSRLTPQKNIRTVIKIIERFANTPYKVKFHFFGEGKEQTVIEELIAKYPANDFIELHGFELSYYSYIKKMNMFLHLPFWEGLGNSVLEVFNSGIPMILSNVESGYSELIHTTNTNIHYVDPLVEIDKIVHIIQQYISGEIKAQSNRQKLDLTTSYTYNAYRMLIN
jgi:glycosyltransferase involved in cell wall biosynthesis